MTKKSVATTMRINFFAKKTEQKREKRKKLNPIEIFVKKISVYIIEKSISEKKLLHHN